MNKYEVLSVKTRSQSNKKTNKKILEFLDEPLKKPKSPYMLWSEKERKKLKEKMSDNRELLRELGNLWSKMPNSEKNHWQELSNKHKQIYNEKLNLIFSCEKEFNKNLIIEKEVKIKSNKKIMLDNAKNTDEEDKSKRRKPK